MQLILSVALLRPRRGALRSFIDGLLDGDPIAISVLVLGVMLTAGLLVLLLRHKKQNDEIFRDEARQHGHDMALVRRLVREHRAAYDILSMMWLGIGVFLAIPGAFLSPVVAVICLALCACAAAWCKVRRRKIPEVDSHPVVLLARDTPHAVVNARWVGERGVVHLSLTVGEPSATYTFKLDSSWGAELIQRLPSIFPSARLVRSDAR